MQFSTAPTNVHLGFGEGTPGSGYSEYAKFSGSVGSNTVIIEVRTSAEGVLSPDRTKTYQITIEEVV